MPFPRRFIHLAIALTGACGSEDGGGGTGTYPAADELARKTAPSFGAMTAMRTTDPMASLVPSTTYDSAADYDTATSAMSDTLKSILGSADDMPAPVTRLHVQVRNAQQLFERINSEHTDEFNAPKDCTPIDASVAVKTPFFSTQTGNNAPFFTIEDAGKYQCYFIDETPPPDGGTSKEIVLFGRTAIDPPTANCIDPNQYYVAFGRMHMSPNTVDTATRGTTVTVSGVGKISYNGCDTTVKLLFAHNSKYELGAEFSSRIELSGTVLNRSGALRGFKLDVGDATMAAANGYNGTTTIMAGKTALGEGETGQANFIAGFNNTFCAQAGSCNPPTEKNFCIKNTGTINTYSYDGTGTDCTAAEASYLALVPIVADQVPRTAINIDPASWGL